MSEISSSTVNAESLRPPSRREIVRVYAGLRARGLHELAHQFVCHPAFFGKVNDPLEDFDRIVDPVQGDLVFLVLPCFDDQMGIVYNDIGEAPL